MTLGLVVGAGGIGAEVAKLTRSSVDHLVAFDLDGQKLQELCSELDCVGVAGDICSDDSRNALVERICGLDQPLRWVVLSAGVGLRGELAETSPERIRSVFEANVVAPILLFRELLGRVSWAAQARIVGVGSISARRALPGRSVYSATKAGLEAFLTALGVELANRGILVNLVSAGVTDTDFIRAARSDLQSWAAGRVPVGRLGAASEIASVIAYLLLEAPGYLTCARIVVDGGAEAMP